MLIRGAARRRAHKSSGAEASITAYMTTETEGKGTVEVDDRGLVVRFVEKEPPTGRPALVNAGLYILEPEFAARIPEGVVADFGHDVLPAAAADGVRIALFQLAAPVLDVGTPDALEAARARHP